MMSDIFNIFSIDWWMDENNNALQMTDSVLFLLLAIPVAYLLLCALFSLGKYRNPYPAAAVQHRFLVLFTVLRNGKEVIESINRFLDTQQYPRDKYDVAVAATQLPEEDLITLLQMPVNIVVPDKEYCTKVYAIQQVMERYAPDEYDMIVLFNSDNHIVPNALSLFNDAYYSGCDSIQAHRMAENLNTSIAVLNATSEEINNNLFRLAHTRMGFSSALIGSAMAFDFAMFHERAPKLKGSDISKAMETALLEQMQGTLKLLGSKGTTGTQASFLELFNGDDETIDKIDPMIAKKMGFKDCYPVSGQTYSRKVDTRVVNVLAGIAASATKMSNDIRLLQHLKEVEEPFEKNQIGSSAMAYKRNPMRSERIASLSRYVLADVMNPAITSATQWFERTLDDSANKRLSIPEGFLAIDGILDLCLNVVDGLVVYPKVIEKHFMAEIPFMATENIMMDAVKNGGNRQELHEKIRQLSMQAGKTVKEEGKENNLVDLIAADPAFGLTKADIEKNLKPELYVGRAPRQVEVYLRDVVNPVLEAHKDESGVKAEINV